MSGWIQELAESLGIRHSDTIAVVRAGRLAKLRTRRRDRRKAKHQTQLFDENG